MDKVERLISIIMILLRKELVSATEFARLFQVSKRTILRDMETLSLANIPIYAVNGVGGGYGIMEEYKVDKRLVSNADLENILTALGGLERILVGEEVGTTIKKIEAMVGPLPLNRSVQLSFYEWEGRSEMVDALRICQQSIVQRRLVTFHYIDKNGTPTTRTVEPYELHFSESSWYLIGFCLQRQEYRTFKLSRMDRLSVDERSYRPRDESTAQTRDTSFKPQLVTIKVLISPSIQDQFIERYGRKCIEHEHDNSERLLATIDLPQNRNGFQFLAGFGTELTILEPRTYVEDFRDYISQMMNIYA